MSNIPLNVTVQCSDQPCGKSTNVVVNPVAKKITHIVVQDKKLPSNPTRLVPISKVASTTSTEITLSCTYDEVAKMPPFMVTHFVQESGSGMDYASGEAYTSQYTVNDTAYDSVTDADLPVGELSVYSGMEVEATDGKVGKLDELVLDPKSGEITHIQMRKGHLWGKKDVAIPYADIDFTDGDTVYLNIDKNAVKALPAVKVKR